ncbi:hemolysin family protein [Estrella lausannensis]|uniref:Uncharacterized protein n=1 Tax=Estrella lausannensis TaxID=483423 RepID=A0A0H5E4K5_9BACT|nr:hemolysin family protein [Estrella lausannensis]CRX38150.1 Conserved hypothetical protein [Estrella lausannensis]
MESPLLPLTIFILLFLSAFFSSSEVALFSLSPQRVNSFKTSHNAREKLIGSLLHRSKDLLVTVFIMNTLVNILLQNASSAYFEGLGGWAFKVGLPLFLTLVFGEIIPKTYGIENSISLSYKVAPLIALIQKALTPLRKIVVAITYPVSKILFFYLRKASPISKDELTHALKASKLHGVLTDEEAALSLGYLNLQTRNVREVMRPKEDILFYDLEEPLTKLEYLFMEKECSRIPVCKSGLDQVVGVMTIKSYFLNRPKITAPEHLLRFVEPSFYVPETITARVLLKKMQKYSKTFALVVDEYGAVSGVITDEDLAEVVVGEISDARDEKQQYIRQSRTEIIATGRFEIDELEDVFGFGLNNPSGMVTVAGWLTERVGEIPKTGQKFENEDYLFQILASDPTRVKKIYIRKK